MLYPIFRPFVYFMSTRCAFEGTWKYLGLHDAVSDITHFNNLLIEISAKSHISITQLLILVQVLFAKCYLQNFVMAMLCCRTQ